MKKRFGLDLKGLFLQAMFRRWRSQGHLDEGYSLLLPMPMDMPFLLRYALEGLRHVDTRHCKQILVVPDGCGDDGGKGLRHVASAFDDPRIEIVDVSPLDSFLIRRLRGGGSALHWMAIVRGVNRVRCNYTFLHDSDAFFVEFDGLERQYLACRDRGMDTLGVAARWDPFFERIGYVIPGTWEMMFSTRWARRHRPYDHKGRWRETAHGGQEFDTMLYPQYLDFPAGRVGVLTPPPRVVHFHGTIVTYRVFRDVAHGPVVDEMFRILLLALLEELVPGSDGRRVVPTVEELARGLTDPETRVTYGTAGNTREYPTFRGLIDELCESPIFRGERADRIRALIRPFDEFFAGQSTPLTASERGGPRHRSHGLA